MEFSKRNRSEWSESTYQFLLIIDIGGKKRNVTFDIIISILFNLKENANQFCVNENDSFNLMRLYVWLWGLLVPYAWFLPGKGLVLFKCERRVSWKISRVVWHCVTVSCCFLNHICEQFHTAVVYVGVYNILWKGS